MKKKNIIFVTKEFFEKYKLNKFLILSSQGNVETNRYKKNKINNCKNYIFIIDVILDTIDPEYSNLLKGYFLDNLKKEQMHYSNSTFYSKIAKACKEFMFYWNLHLNNADINTIQ